MADQRFNVDYNGVRLAGPLTLCEVQETAKKVRDSLDHVVSLYLHIPGEAGIRWIYTLDRYIPRLRWRGGESSLTAGEVEGLGAFLEAGPWSCGWHGREITAPVLGLLARDLARTGDPAIAAVILKVTAEGGLWASGVR